MDNLTRPACAAVRSEMGGAVVLGVNGDRDENGNGSEAELAVSEEMNARRAVVEEHGAGAKGSWSTDTLVQPM